jgi:hypothetical protein
MESIVTVKKRVKASCLPFVALALLAVLPACNSGMSTPTGGNAVITVSVDPSPVIGVQNSTTQAMTASFKVKIEEVNGVGGEVQYVSVAVFDPESGAQMSLVYFDGADLVVYVGSKRIEPLGTFVVPETVSYLLSDGRREAIIVVAVQVRDDSGYLINRSLMAKIK